MVSFVEHPETASYNWEYTGGCYENGAVAVYEDAVPGETYTFDSVPIEVREDESLSTAFEHTAEKSEFYLITIVGFLSKLFFFLAGGLFVYFIILYILAWNGMRGGGSKH